MGFGAICWLDQPSTSPVSNSRRRGMQGECWLGNHPLILVQATPNAGVFRKLLGAPQLSVYVPVKQLTSNEGSGSSSTSMSTITVGSHKEPCWSTQLPEGRVQGPFGQASQAEARFGGSMTAAAAAQTSGDAC
jgi:hypothetical protein